MAIILDSKTRAALDNLLAVARTDTGQARKVANFLLAWHNAAENGGFDPTELWAIDDSLVEDCTTVFLWIATNQAYPDDLGQDYKKAFQSLWRLWRERAGTGE